MSATSIYNNQANGSKKFSLILSPIDTPIITIENNLPTITGTSNYKIQSNILNGNNRVIPDFKNDLSGTFELNRDCETVELESDISLDEVKKEIMEYLDTHSHARTSDIVFDLNIDPALVVEALNALELEDLIEGKALDVKKENK